MSLYTFAPDSILAPSSRWWSEKLKPWDTARASVTWFDQELQSWDMAFKDMATSDYVAGGTWGIKGADRYLLDQKRERLGFPETVAAVKAMSLKWPKASLKLVE
jgi:phage terminase large subunit-like protein